MPKKGHSEEQIVTALRQGEAREKVSDDRASAEFAAGHRISAKPRFDFDLE